MRRRSSTSMTSLGRQTGDANRLTGDFFLESSRWWWWWPPLPKKAFLFSWGGEMIYWLSPPPPSSSCCNMQGHAGYVFRLFANDFLRSELLPESFSRDRPFCTGSSSSTSSLIGGSGSNMFPELILWLHRARVLGLGPGVGPGVDIGVMRTLRSSMLASGATKLSSK